MSEWHLRKDITVGNIIVTVMLLMAVVGGYYNHDKRIALLEQAQLSDKEDVERVCRRLDRIENLQIEVLRKIGE